MADDDTTQDAPAEAVADDADPKAAATATDIPPEVKKALAKANKEAETYRLRLKEIEDRDKSELQKERERAEAAEKRATEFEQTALRTRVASEMGVIPEVINGADEEAMRASAQRVLDWANSNKPKPPPPKSLKSGSGGSPSGEPGRAAAALRALRQG